MAKNKKKVPVSLVILTLGSEDLVKKELSDFSKLQLEGINLSCIVVDGRDGPKTSKYLKTYKTNKFKYFYLKTGKNLGFAGGNNFGISKALKEKSKYIIVMNDDMLIPDNLVKNLVDYMEENQKVGLCSPKIYFAKGYEFHKKRYKKSDLGKVFWYTGGVVDWDNIYSSHRGVDKVDKGQYEKTAETDFASGACMIIRSSLIKDTGLLDDSLFLYWEDSDFSTRVKNKGFKVTYFPGAYIWHKVSSTTGGIGSESNDYFLVRNRYYFAMRHASLRTKFAVLRDTLRLATNGRKWQKKGAIDALIGTKGKGSWR